MEKNEYYSTTDLTLATVISLFYPLDCIERLSDKRKAFIFKRENDFDQIIEAFWKRKMRVEPLNFSEHRKMLLTRMGNEEECGI